MLGTRARKNNMQMNIDVTRSLRGSPPIKIDEKRGLEWKDRKLLKRKRVVYHDAHPIYAQVRPDGSKWEDIKLHIDSFKVYGYCYEEPPPQVIEDPERPGWYIGIAGWTKDDALDTLQVSTFIYDVYKINSDLNIRRQKLRSNIVKTHRRGNTEASITAEITQAIEEGELDIESVENELVEKRHYTSTNRWVPTKDIKNGYVINTRHTMLISDAAALDLIVF